MAGTLYIVATPIGNLGDRTKRLEEILASVSLVACEDTRVTGKLLSACDIQTPKRAIHQHSSDRELREVVDILLQGDDVAYVSDAGTPGISDPGGKLVEVAWQHGIAVRPIPGPTASSAALSVCGFPADRFTFLGFPPQKRGRSAYFEQIMDIPHTVVFFESTHRIMKTLEALPDDRMIFLGRELTKMHETHYRGLRDDVINHLKETSQKGEYVIVLAPKSFS